MIEQVISYSCTEKCFRKFFMLKLFMRLQTYSLVKAVLGHLYKHYNLYSYKYLQYILSLTLTQENESVEDVLCFSDHRTLEKL